MKLKKVLFLNLFLAFLNLSVYSSEILNPQIIKENFNFTLPSVSFENIKTEIKPVIIEKGNSDFSSIRPYAFAYINQLIVDAVNLSNSSVECVIYSINMKDIPDALLAARDRGVKVRIIIDEAHVYPYSHTEIKKLINAGDGIEVRTLRGTRKYGVNHNKITIHDREMFTTGSYNWTFGSTFSNYENTLAIKDKRYVKGYVDYFEWMWSKARTIEQGPSDEVPVGYYGVPPQDNSGFTALNGVNVPKYLFSPGSDTETRLARLIDAAKKSVDAVTFTFSSQIIADAIVRAHSRGVKVRFLQDIDMAKSSYVARYVYQSGVPFKWRGGRNEKGALHSKFIILDGKILGTGSFNFTVNASVNSFENMVFTDDKNIVDAYIKKFDWFYSTATSPQSADDFDEIDDKDVNFVDKNDISEID